MAPVVSAHVRLGSEGPLWARDGLECRLPSLLESCCGIGMAGQVTWFKVGMTRTAIEFVCSTVVFYVSRVLVLGAIPLTLVLRPCAPGGWAAHTCKERGKAALALSSPLPTVVLAVSGCLWLAGCLALGLALSVSVSVVLSFCLSDFFYCFFSFNQ